MSLLLLLNGCSDPDKVPLSHISTPPAAAASSMEIERFPQGTALFGDLHVHTSWSSDAYAGENRLGPNTAYRFAKGDKVELQNGIQAQLPAPLDFVALTDHAENFEVSIACTMLPDSPEFALQQCRDMRSGELDMAAMLKRAFSTAGERPQPHSYDICGNDKQCQANAQDTWQRVQAVANAHDEPGRFTALIGYEFSSLLPEMGMLHRNVIFRGSDVIPHAISSIDVRNQKEFFDQLDAACDQPCEVLTIPHNTNYSWGLTFSRTDEDGSAYSDEDLERRARIERLFEVTQQKGNSECQISVGASDEDCNFGNMFPPCEEAGDRRCANKSSFLRNVLLDGIALGTERPINPYKLGVIGSTDTHTSDPGNTKNGIPVRFKPAEGTSFAVNRIMEMDHPVAGPLRRFLPGGLAGVWAKANTRADIFDALQRRETFGTSGSRMLIRFFGGKLPINVGQQDDPIALAYEHGVPMGSDLDPTDAPRFWVWASQDPNGPPLDRIQIVKGWVEDSEHHQRVWDVVCSSGRTPDKQTGKCSKTTADVDLSSCERTGKQGAPELEITFSDPDYSTEQPAFYYVRVLENPVCSWTTRLANSSGSDLPEDVSATVQERGWSSPIWSASR
ncbi:MAG: DUF3604 domain-containing protein [Gammaproteobacteria bacterium]|nr:DUF3604 domain-containing protein [Gammaproteobacteria bacterium]